MNCKKLRLIRVLGSIGLGLLFAMVFADYDNYSFKDRFFITWAFDAAIAYFLWEGNYQLYKYLDKHIAWDAIKKRIFIQSSVSLLLTTVVIYGLVPIYLMQFFDQEYPSVKSLLPTFFVTVLVTIMITALNAGNDFLAQWKKTIREQEELKRKFSEAQYRALRSQVNPHFLFNSFNTLNALILESGEQSRKYVGELAAFYRKVLNQPNSEMVTLEEELALLNNYLFLLQTRHEDDLTVIIEDVSERLMQFKIPHMSLQLCLENAVKHNKVSSKHKLSVQVYFTQQAVHVVNIVAPKQVLQSESSGLGLKQIDAVYSSFGASGFKYFINDDKFCVTLPLISNENTDS